MGIWEFFGVNWFQELDLGLDRVRVKMKMKGIRGFGKKREQG